MDGTYQVFLETPMGKMQGTLYLETKGEELEGYLEAMGNRNKIEQGKVIGNEAEFSGQIRHFLGSISYQAKIQINDGKVEAKVNSNMGVFKVTGKKISQ